MSPLEIALIVMVVMFIIGMPIYMSLCIAAAVTLVCGDILPLTIIHNSLFDGLNLFPLLAIPCFVVAGTLMEYGNITNQIIDVVKQIVGRTYGGLGITTILACTFFAAISGSGPGTVAAVGTILIPSMIHNGYSKDYAAAAASSGGTIGILIPPSNPMIIYAILGNLSVTAMFTAGFVPGFIVAFSMIVTAWLLARKHGFRGDPNAKFHLGHFLQSCRKGFFALMTPIIILGSIYSGYATPVEASVVAILYALFVGIVINRSLRLTHIYKALLEGSMICGTVLLIVGASTLFGKILTFEEAPQKLTSLVLGISKNPYVVLLMIIAVLYIRHVHGDAVDHHHTCPCPASHDSAAGHRSHPLRHHSCRDEQRGHADSSARREPLRLIKAGRSFCGKGVCGSASLSGGADPVYPSLYLLPQTYSLAASSSGIRPLAPEAAYHG